ncbi:ATP-binding protein [Crossiella sp. CA198]|uniref:ATP-binding protein n=1 Tax=Crossiella sp. CA198 TaxID=3455607 RepID=UPI003F8D1EAC
MDLVDLVELVTELRGEGSDLAEVEVKRAAGGFPRSLVPTLSAFGNTPGGGLVIFGLDEGQGFAARGVYNVVQCKQALAAAARKSVVPPLTVASTTLEFEGVELVVAEINELPGSARPCRVSATGKAYLRGYDGDYQLSELEEQAFLANRETPRFDQQPVAAAAREDLAPDLIESYTESCLATSMALRRFEPEELLFRTGVLVLDEQGRRVPSVAGLLALGAYPQQYFPNLVIQASVAPGPADPPGTRAVDPVRFDGPLPMMLDEALRWVTRNARSRIRFGADGHGRDEAEYPPEAVRELLSNALVHRDLGPYALGEAITLRLENDQLVLSNPGGLWGLTAARLGTTGVTSARNGMLVRICQNVRYAGELRVVEALATGIPTVLRTLREAGMVPPRFHDQGIRFTVRMPSHSLLGSDDLEWLGAVTEGRKINDVQRHVLATMRQGAGWTNKSLRTAFPMDSRDARRTLGGLVEAGLAEAHGERGGRVYRLASRIPTVVPPEVDLGDRSGPAVALVTALRSGALTMNELLERTGLTYRQAQYTLAVLRAEGVVTLEGGRGRRGSHYRLV